MQKIEEKSLPTPNPTQTNPQSPSQLQTTNPKNPQLKQRVSTTNSSCHHHQTHYTHRIHVW